MTAARLDAVLQEGSLRAAKGDYSDDVPCCTVVSRSGNGGTFGSPTDGLDSINDGTVLTAVLNQSGGRVKVVKVTVPAGQTGSLTLNAGDVVSFVSTSTPVNSVNPQSYQSTGQTAQFVVTATTADAAGAITIPIDNLAAVGGYRKVGG